MPPGPTYNDREKRYALTVLNSIACFSVDRCYSLLSDMLEKMLANRKQNIKARKQVPRQ
jgi:hypothetical protein